MGTCLARPDGRLYCTLKDTDINIQQHCDHLAKTPRALVMAVLCSAVCGESSVSCDQS